MRGVQAGPSQEQHGAHHLEQRQAASGLNLVGEEITILARLLDDEPQTLKVAGISAIGLTGTRDQAAATRFVLQDGTGHLFAGVAGFAELFPSGYGMVVVPTGATGIGAYVPISSPLLLLPGPQKTLAQEKKSQVPSQEHRVALDIWLRPSYYLVCGAN